MLFVSYILDENFRIVGLACTPVSLPVEQEAAEEVSASEGIVRGFLDHYSIWN